MPRYASGDRIAQYHIEHHLSSGGFADVYLARDPTTQGQVAVKILRDPHNREDRHRFESEYLLLKRVEQLGKPHIIRCLAYDRRDDLMYMVLPYYPQRLDTWARQPQPDTEIVRVIGEIAGALDTLHYDDEHHGQVVHSDVKPHNILLDSAGMAVLIDLNAAFRQRQQIDDELPQGTIPYMPPEWHNGFVIPASDQFSLAAVAYQLLTGEMLINTDKPDKALQRLIELQSTGYAAIDKRLENRFATADVLKRALAYEQSERYESCRVFAERLSEAVVYDIVGKHQRKSVSVSARGQRGSRPQYAFFASALITILVVVLALWWLFSDVPSQPQSVPVPVRTSAPSASLPTADRAGGVWMVDLRSAVPGRNEGSTI